VVARSDLKFATQHRSYTGCLPRIGSSGPLIYAKVRRDVTGKSPSKKSADPVAGTPGMLATWKGIAEYFGCNVRTVRRYEQERGLPVHRAPGRKGCTVFAYASELDAWMDSKDDNEQKPSPAVRAGRTAVHRDDAAQSHSLQPAVKQLPAKTVAEHWAIEALLRRWQVWIFAASALLIASPGLFWSVENHQSAFSDTTAKFDMLKSRPHVAAPATEDLILRGCASQNCNRLCSAKTPSDRTIAGS